MISQSLPFCEAISENEMNKSYLSQTFDKSYIEEEVKTIDIFQSANT